MSQLRACFILTLALTSTSGCKGCSDGGEAPPATEDRAEQSENAQVRARVDALKLDHSKVYPKAADGSISCGTDKSCFILQADACAKAELSFRQDLSGFGAVQRVDFVYRIEGREAGKCKVTRRVAALGVDLSAPLLDFLHKKGNTDAEVQTMKSDAEEQLRTNNPTMVECWFSQSALLETALDLADNKYKPQVWRDGCREISEKVPPPGNAFKPTDGK